MLFSGMAGAIAFGSASIALPGPLSSRLVQLAAGLMAGRAVAKQMRLRRLSWTWTLPADVIVLQLAPHVPLAGPLLAAAAGATLWGRRWHRADLRAGGDLAQAAAGRVGPLSLLRSLPGRWLLASTSWLRRRAVTGDGLLLGRDERGASVRIPLGGRDGATHTLVVGATGSGKTVTQAAVATRAIADGAGAIVIDPKGDHFLRSHLQAAAGRAGRRFVEWTPEGPTVYNPFARGSETEIADKTLSAETYTEPHYLRQAQRYLGQEVRLLRAAGVEISLATLVAHMEPAELELAARRLGEPGAAPTFSYLDSLSPRQRRDLAGTRDRLAVLAESDAGRWLDPAHDAAFDLLAAIRERAVVLFRLDADRRPLLAAMLGAAIVQDLITGVAALQAEPARCVVVIDEFSAVSAEHVARLFARARSAGVSLLLGTQELSDLRLPGRAALLESVLGNVAAIVAHRQVVPDSADLIAGIAGTRGAWSTALRSDGGRTHTRVREYAIHPDQIKSLPRGWAAVLVPGGETPVRVTRVLPPDCG